MNNIEQIVCDHYGVTLEEMKDDLRTQKHSVPRQIIYYFSSRYMNLSHSQLAIKYNHKNSDVYNGIKRALKLMNDDKWYWLTIKELKFKIYPGLHVMELGQIKEI